MARALGGVLLVLASGCLTESPTEPMDGGVSESDAGAVDDAGVEMDAGQPGPPDAGPFYKTPAPCSGTPRCTSYEDRSGEAEPSNQCIGQICSCERSCMRLRVGQRLILNVQAGSANAHLNGAHGFVFETPGCFAPLCNVEVDVVP